MNEFYLVNDIYIMYCTKYTFKVLPFLFPFPPQHQNCRISLLLLLENFIPVSMEEFIAL